MKPRRSCANDNHGRAVVTVRFCPSCGEIVNGGIRTRPCLSEQHARMRRTQNIYCVNCGERLILAR